MTSRSKRLVGVPFASVLMLAILIGLAAPQSQAQQQPPSKWDIFAGYAFIRPGDTIGTHKLRNIAAGYGTSTTFFFTDHWGITLDSGGHFGRQLNMATVMGGPTVRFPMEHATPFLHAAVGLHRVSPGLVGVSLEPNNGFGASAGGGVDVRLARYVSWRVFDADYVYGRHTFGGVSGTTGMNGFRARTGIVFNILPSGPPPAPPSAACTATPSDVFAGEPVRINAAAANFNPKRKLTYTWNTTGGKLDGTMENSTVDTTGLAPGSYTVTTRVSDSKKAIAECTSTFNVKSPRGPEISCTADPSTVQPGGSSTITCNGTSADNRQLTYDHKASAGTLTANGNTASLNSTGASTGPITVTSTVTDDRGMSASTGTTVTVAEPAAPPAPPPAPTASKLNQIDFKRNSARVDNTAKALLDDVALRLQRDADAKLVIVGAADANERGGKKLAGSRAQNIKTYLTSEKGIDPSRIELRTGSEAGTKADVYLVPAGATFTEEGTETVTDAPARAPRKRKAAAAPPPAQ